MRLLLGHRGREAQISALFRAVFGDAEGPDEGRIVGGLVDDLMRLTPEADLLVCVAEDGQRLVGCVIFSRLVFVSDPRQAFILSPAAVATDRQRSGVGRSLIGFGLAELRRRGVDVAVTYGDPDYYSKSGFRPVSETDAPPPYPLSQPHGWVAQSLSGAALTPFSGVSRSVEALSRQDVW